MRKKLIAILIVIPCFFMIPFLFGMSSSLLSWYTTQSGFVLLRPDFYNYTVNVETSFGQFTNAVNKFSSINLQWDTITHCLISICNTLIAILNTFLIPISLFSCISNSIFALWGFPCDSSNFIWNAVNVINSLQIPYLTY